MAFESFLMNFLSLTKFLDDCASGLYYSYMNEWIAFSLIHAAHNIESRFEEALAAVNLSGPKFTALSALVAHTGWHWMLERWERLAQFRVQWPEINAAFLDGVMGWLMVIALVVGMVWVLGNLAGFAAGWTRWKAGPQPERPPHDS